MPDPAVEAARLGLPYTEPKGQGMGLSGVKGMKVRFERDPNNPYAAPRRIIEKMGFWERTFGIGSGGSGGAVMKQTKYTPAPPMDTFPASVPLDTSYSPRPLPPITSTNHPSSTNTHLQPTPFPLDFKYLPRSEQKAWKHQRQEEIKFLRALDKEQRAAEKADVARREREAKEARDKEKEELKARKAAIKLEKKLGYRPLPQLTGSNIAQTYRPLPSMMSSNWNMNHTPTSRTTNATAVGQPTSWMLLPTLEEFGVRRPFDAPGRPEGLGGRKVDIGGTEWPMMSKTMTHALQDVAREERVHMEQAGHTWSPAWYRD